MHQINRNVFVEMSFAVNLYFLNSPKPQHTTNTKKIAQIPEEQ